MVTIAHNFNDIADNDYLDDSLLWWTNKTSGSRMRSDQHDHSDGSQVIDGSADFGGVPQGAIFQTPFASSNHRVGLVDVFPDYDQNNYVGVIARSNSATSWANCYMAYIHSSSINALVELFSVVGGSLTSLGAKGLLPISTSHVYSLELICDGSSISAVVDGVPELEVTNTDIVSGLYGGIYFDRETATTNGQPWIDNFYGSDLAAGPVWDGSFFRNAAGNKTRVRMPNGDAAAIYLPAGGRL